MNNPRQSMLNAFSHRYHKGIVPAWDIEFHPVEKMFGRKYSFNDGLNNMSRKEKEKALHESIGLLVKVAERFEYSAIYIPGGYWKGAYIWIPEIKDQMESIKILKKMTGDKYLIIANSDGTFGIPEGATMLDFVFYLNDHPEEAKDNAEKNARKVMETGCKLIEAGAEAIFMGADYCYNTGPFLSPQMFREFVQPYLAKQIECFKKEGAYTIKHTDGNIMPILDQLLECNPTAIHSLDPGAGIDIKEIKRLAGDRVCLIGNVDCRLLQSGTPEEVYENAVYSLKHGMPGGGYVYSCSNVIMADVPEENYSAMVKARKDFGMYD